MTLLRTIMFCLVTAASTLSATVLAEDVLVYVNSVQGRVVIHLSDNGTGSVPIHPVAGDVLVGPLTIETGSNSNIDIRVRGNSVSISAGSSVFVENIQPVGSNKIELPS